jgi:hypothetical protein
MKYGDLDKPDSIDTTMELVHDKLVGVVASNTTLLIHGGGPNNGATFYDNASTPHTLTAAGTTGTPVYSNSTYKFRVSSIKFVKANKQYITAADSADWAFGTGNFTIDFWFNLNSINTEHVFVAQYAGTSWYVEIGNTNKIVLDSSSGGSFIMTNAWSGLTVGTWHHVAVVRSGSTCLMFADGVSQAVTTVTPFGTWDDVNGPLYIGTYQPASSAALDGYMDEIRISKGTARWTSDFTPSTTSYDSPLTQYVIDGLDGDTDEEYRLIYHYVNGFNGASYTYIRFNNDAGSNYGYQRIYGYGAVAGASRGTDQYQFIGGANLSPYLGNVALSDTVIYAKSGKVRTSLMQSADQIVGKTVTEVEEYGHSWNNTTDNITSIVFTVWTGGGAGTYGNNFGAGTRIILLRKRKITSGMKTGEIDPVGLGASVSYGHWQLIYDNTLTSAATQIDITGLDGNRDVVYKLVGRLVNGYNGGANARVCLNYDSIGGTVGNYGYQVLTGTSTGVIAAQSTTYTGYLLSSSSVLSDIGLGELLIYAKSGFIRPALLSSTYGISGTAVGYITTWGWSWNNTADNITSISIVNYANAIAIGSHIELWRLNL